MSQSEVDNVRIEEYQQVSFNVLKYLPPHAAGKSNRNRNVEVQWQWEMYCFAGDGRRTTSGLTNARLFSTFDQELKGVLVLWLGEDYVGNAYFCAWSLTAAHHVLNIAFRKSWTSYYTTKDGDEYEGDDEDEGYIDVEHRMPITYLQGSSR